MTKANARRLARMVNSCVSWWRCRDAPDFSMLALPTYDRALRTWIVIVASLPKRTAAWSTKPPTPPSWARRARKTP